MGKQKDQKKKGGEHYLQLLKLKDYSSYLMADETSAKESALLSLKMKYNKINIDSISRLKLTWE